MGEAVVGAAIQIVLQNLLTISQEQINLVRDFNKDLEKLKNSFLMLNNFLYDAELQQVTDRSVKLWLTNLEDIAFHADNVLDEISYQLLCKDKLKRKVKSFFSHSKLARKIRDINMRLEMSNQQAIGFGLQTKIAVGCGSDASATIDTDSFLEEPIFLGRENDLPRIVEMLITNSSIDEHKLSVLPIVGMGGLGKTTLTRKVFGHQHSISHFGDNRVWVHVPRKFDVISLLKNILTSMAIEHVEHGNREALLKKLQNSLGAKRYLLVLDDLWIEENEKGKWDSFVNSLSGISSVTGNCMIVTTRSHDAASFVNTLPIHDLKGLSTDDCWSIIKAKAIKSGDIPTELETMGINIAKRCQGLPLAASVVGGLLCNKSKDEWLSIEKNWLSNFGDENPISKILKLSFDNLSSPSLKKCFAYCSIFPKGYEITKETLILLWMAEGFLPTDQRSDMETTGNKFFKLLLQNSLLQVTNRDICGNVTHWNMHDLVRDVACSVLGQNDTVGDGIRRRRRYIGYNPNGDIESLSIPKEEAKYVRTLFFSGKFSDINFSDFESLRTLILVGEDIDELPKSIRELIHLRYLDIADIRVQKLPDAVGELYHLQTLRAYDLENLPDSLKYLINLRHLRISHSTLPPEIGRLTSLQTLLNFDVGHEKGRRISELGSLKNLRGKLGIRNLEKVRDKNEALSADICRKREIFKLNCIWSASRQGEANDESVLEGLQPHTNLKSLYICEYRGKSLPSWTLKMAVRDDIVGRWEGLNNLTEIALVKCSECEELPMLGQLPHLKSLYLRDLKNVRSIGSSFYNIEKCTKSSSSNNGVCKSDTVVVFRALERLDLIDMPNYTEWVGVELLPGEGCEVVVFPCLARLTVGQCRQLMRAPSHFPCLKELTIYQMDSSLPLENICGMKLTPLTYLKIGEIQGLEHLPDGLFCNNHNLSILHIYDCPNMTHLVPRLGGGGACLKELQIKRCMNLRGLPDDLHSLNSLEISKCPSLKSIPYLSSEDESQRFTSLRGLSIRNCKGLTNLPVEIVDSCAPSLEWLHLEGLGSLTNLSTVIGCLHKMPRLARLVILDVPNISVNSAHHHVEIGTIYSSLRELIMSPSSSSSDSSSSNNVSFNEAVDVILRLSRFSLCKLNLYGMDQWDSLPDHLQHLNAVSSLYLYKFGIEALPEWFGNLSSLKELGLHDCVQLRHLPSKEAMLRLTKLTYFNICNCPLLLKERGNNTERRQIDESEWPKISHISNVCVDYKDLRT